MGNADISVTRPFASGTGFGRHLVSQREDPAKGALPPVSTYRCLRVPQTLEGQPIDPAIWAAADWSSPFRRISGGQPTVETRIAMLWDDANLYVSFRVEGPHRDAIMRSHRDHVYIADDSVELFVDGAGHYYEIGRNSINNGYEVRWVWLEELVERRDFEGLESWITTSDFIYYRRREGEPIGRIGDMNYALPDLVTSVWPEQQSADGGDGRWQAELILPWTSVEQAVSGIWPPLVDDERRFAGYRIHHGVDPCGHGQTKEQQTWSVMGNADVHNPERWTLVTFVDESLQLQT
jgi:hypothetical protein